MKPTYAFTAVLITLLFLTGCQSMAPLALIPARQIETQKLTLGSVQANVRVGVSGDDVIAALGSPNIITQSADKSETWVYDKVATEAEVATGYNSAVAVRSTRTMLVTVKFGLDKRVKDVSYRQTSY
jgi:hypothetical protein